MIHFFCALPCEAESLIEHYQLKPAKQYPLFRLYQSGNHDISLTITGIGKTNAAAAVSYQHACLHTADSDIWINVGVAGHRDLPIGQPCMVNKITEVATGSSWFPQLLPAMPCQSHPLLTLDTPSNDYQQSLFDMEAAGFYALAIRLGTAELVHVFKVISDNRKQDSHTVKAAEIKQLLTAQLHTLDKIVEALQPLAEELRLIRALPVGYEQAITTWHFTQTERRQLEQLLRQWQCRFPDEDALEQVAGATAARAVIQALQQYLAATPFELGKPRTTQHG